MRISVFEKGKEKRETLEVSEKNKSGSVRAFYKNRPNIAGNK